MNGHKQQTICIRGITGGGEAAARQAKSGNLQVVQAE